MITKNVKTKTAGKGIPMKKKQQKANKATKEEQLEVLELTDQKSIAKVGNHVGDGETTDRDVGAEQTVFIASLPADTNRAQLVELFKPYGKIMFIHFSNPFADIVQAYVVLDSAEAADKAMELNGINNMYLRIPGEECLDPKTTVVVKCDKSSLTNENLHETFAACGDIESVKILKNKKTSECLSTACVQFKNTHAVCLALKIKSLVADNIPIRIEMYSTKKAGIVKKVISLAVKKNPRISSTKNTVFVQNLKTTTSKAKLKKLFSSCGEIQYVKLLRDPINHVAKGKAFVCFKSPESVSLALQFNDTILDEQPIRVLTYSKKPSFSKANHKKIPVASSEGIKKAPKKLNKKIASKT